MTEQYFTTPESRQKHIEKNKKLTEQFNLEKLREKLPSKRQWRVTIAKTFWDNVRCMPSGCWEWQRAKTGSGGYGQLWLNGKIVRAHRFAYEKLMGKIPEGLTLHHLCKNTKCVSPMHLLPTTMGENTRLGDTGINHRSKTHCPKGHPYTPENTYLTYQYNGSPHRGCKICNAENGRKRRELIAKSRIREEVS